MEKKVNELTLNELKEDKWYHVEAIWLYSNAVTGIKMIGDKIVIQFIGGDFEEPYLFWFNYTKACLDEIYQYHFQADYPHELDKSLDTVAWIHDLSCFPYDMIHDLHYACKHMGESEDKLDEGV